MHSQNKQPKPCPKCKGFGEVTIQKIFREECHWCRGACIDLDKTDLLIDDTGYYRIEVREHRSA